MNKFLEICKDIGFQNEGEKGMEIILKRGKRELLLKREEIAILDCITDQFLKKI